MPGPSRSKPNGSLSADTGWRLLELEKLSGELDLLRIVLFENRHGHVRIWCQGLLEDELWTNVPSGETVDAQLILDFPNTDYVRMPSRLFLERPTIRRLGTRLALRSEDKSRVLAILIVRRDDPQTLADVERIEQFYRNA
jgi:hypothetical protein